MNLRWAGLDNQNLEILVLTQSTRNNGASGAPSYDDEVIINIWQVIRALKMEGTERDLREC